MDKQLENTLRIVGAAWRETDDKVEAMRARCEAIARRHAAQRAELGLFSEIAGPLAIADEIAALNPRKPP